MPVQFAPYPDVAGGIARGYAVGQGIRSGWRARQRAKLQAEGIPEEEISVDIPQAQYEDPTAVAGTPENEQWMQEQRAVMAQRQAAGGIPTDTSATSQPLTIDIAPQQQAPTPSSDVQKAILKRRSSEELRKRMMQYARTPEEVAQVESYIDDTNNKGYMSNLNKALSLYATNPQQAAQYISNAMSYKGGTVLVNATPEGTMVGYEVGDDGKIDGKGTNLSYENLLYLRDLELNTGEFRKSESEIEENIATADYRRAGGSRGSSSTRATTITKDINELNADVAERWDQMVGANEDLAMIVEEVPEANNWPFQFNELNLDRNISAVTATNIASDLLLNPEGAEVYRGRDSGRAAAMYNGKAYFIPTDMYQFVKSKQPPEPEERAPSEKAVFQTEWTRGKSRGQGVMPERAPVPSAPAVPTGRQGTTRRQRRMNRPEPEQVPYITAPTRRGRRLGSGIPEE